MPETDLELLQRAAEAAGEIALGYFKQDIQSWEKDAGAGPVTEADLAVNAALEESLRGARPDYGWLSEESLDSADRQSNARVFIIDPIDGTRSFMSGARTWAHSLAIVEHGRTVAAVVFLPALDKLYTAERGRGAALNGTALAASQQGDTEQADVLAARPTLEAKHWKSGSPPAFARHHRPSLAYRLSLVAEGRYDAMLTLRPSWEWDIAAGALLAEEAGGRVTDKTGAALRFNNPDPRLNGVLAAGANLHAPLLDRLASA